jgi:Cu(I)/Ag(I) efflux system membrane protein CusA/SilA
MRRIATPKVGGMVSATVLTLLVIPAVFLIWKRCSLESVAAPDQRNATAT